MAAFATMSAAEARAKAKVKDGTWINAHSGRTFNGAICVRVQRKMAPTSAATRQNGAWVELTDDAAV
jgi:uncharacterized protein with FMN-binding domain